MSGRPVKGILDGRERLLGAALELMLELHPSENLTITGICARAGCTPPTLYHHYGSLAALAQEAASRALMGWSESKLAQYRKMSDPRERLDKAMRDYLDWAIAHPHVIHTIFGIPGGEIFPSDEAALLEVPVLKLAVTDVAAVTGLDEADPNVLGIVMSRWAAAQGVIILAITATCFTKEVQDRTIERITDALLEAVMRSHSSDGQQ